MYISEDKPQTLEKFKESIARHWENFSSDQYLKLIDSIPHRLSKMAEQKFEYVEYLYIDKIFFHQEFFCTL